MNQKVYIGFGSIINLRNILSKHIPKHIFLVTGKTSYEKSGAKKAIGPILSSFDTTHFWDFEINPKYNDITKGIKIFKEKNCDFVIAVGGGSVMDVAKAINILTSNHGNPADYVTKKEKIENKGKPFVAIPTTSGSGSEATCFAVVYIEKTKYSLANEFMLPDYAIVDPQFTMSLPPYTTASTGMDAFSQAIESYWCINSTAESKKYAKEAIKLIIGNLSKAVNNPNKESREAMAKASYLSGKAVNITKSTACHAISYPITSYFNIPHGHAVGLTLAEMLIYNSEVEESDVLDKRGTEYVKDVIYEIVKLLGAKNVEGASKKIIDLMKEIGLNIRLVELGIKKDEDIDLIIKNGFNPDRVKNNPRELTEEALRKILNNIR